MTKEEFRNLLIPLSVQEQYYHDHPEHASKGFLDGAEISDGVYVINMNGTINHNRSHGAILPGKTNPSTYEYIHFNRQSRFSRVPPHRHDFLEMFYIYSGQCSAVINGKQVILNAGDICIMDTEAIHAMLPVGADDIVLNCLIQQSYFNSRFIDRLASSGPVAQFIACALSDHNRHDQYLLFHSSSNPVIKDLFEEVFCEYLEPGLCSSAIIDSYMTLIFIQMARCYQTVKEQEYRNDSRSYLTEVLQYIEDHFSDCTLEETAEKFGYHPNYLSRAIKKSTGCSFKELVNQTRLQHAAFLLENTNLSNDDIASQCGWNNESQFYRKFSEGYGCTPKSYRSNCHREL